MSAEDDVAALLLALHDGPASASTSPTQAVKPPPPALTAGSRPSSSGSSSQAGPTPFKPAASPSPTPALAFPGAFVVPASSAPGPLPSQLPAATTSSIRRATSPTPNPSARYLSPSLGSGGPSSSTARGGSGSPYDAYYGSTAAAGPSTPAQTGTSLPPFQSLDLEGPQASSSQGFHAGGSGSYYGQSSYYPPPPPSHHYGPQPSYGTGPSSAGSYLSLPPRDPNIHPALQQQQKQQQHPTLQQPPRRPPNSPGQSSDIEPADEDDEQKPPTVSQPPPPPPLAIIPETAAGLAPAPAPAKKRKRASGVGKEGGGKGKGRGKAATAAAAAGIGETSAVAAAASGLHILDPDSGIIRCICESTEDDGFTIQCDHCFAWNHIVCLGIAPSAVPDIYICPVCSPRPVDVPAAKEAQRQWREKAARLAADELERELAARAREAAAGIAGEGGVSDPLATTPTVAESAVAAAAAVASSAISVAPPAPLAPADKPPAKKRKAGSNQHTAARDAREREAAALLLQQQQQQADGTAPNAVAGPSTSAAAGTTTSPATASPAGPVSHKRKSNALLRDILSSSTPLAAGGPAQHPLTPRPHPTSIDISSSRPGTLQSATAGGGVGSFSQAGSPAPSRSGTDDGLDDEGRLEAWMLEFVDVRECLVRDARVRRALERVRKRWVAEIPQASVAPPPSPPTPVAALPVTPVVASAPDLPSVAEEAKASVVSDESKPTGEPTGTMATAMDVDPSPATADAAPPRAEATDVPLAPEPLTEMLVVISPLPPPGSDVAAVPAAMVPPALVSAPAVVPPPPPPAPSVAPPTSPIVPEWSGPQATFGPLDAILPPVYLSGASLISLAASTSIKVLPDSSAAPPQTFTASHPTITTSLLRPVYPRPSMYGLYADNPVAKGDFIGEVLGEVVAGERYRKEPINQYRSLGVPKPGVRALPAPLNLIIDQRGFGNESRFARNSCHPNAVIRPVVFRQKPAGASAGDASANEPTLLFGLFASREIRGREEISVAWDWDDDHIVHALQPILAAHLKSPSTNVPGLATYLQPRFAGVLTHLSSVFYTCACPSKKDCALAQMARVAESKPLLGLADKSSGGGRSSRRQKRPDMGVLVGALRGWRDDEKRRAEFAKEAIDRVLTERASVAAFKPAAGVFQPTTFLAVEEHELEDDDTVVRVSHEDIDMEGGRSEEDAGNASDASTLTEPMSHFSSDSEPDDGNAVDPRTPQRSPSLSPPPLLRTPLVSRVARSGVRRRPNNRVESESPPTTPPSEPLPPQLAATTPPLQQQQQTAEPESPLSDAPESSPVRAEGRLAPSSPPILPLVPESTDIEMSAPPAAEDGPASSSAVEAPLSPPAPAPPKAPMLPLREPTPPPPLRLPTPPPVKRMSLKDWAKRKKEAPTPTPAPELAAARPNVTPEAESVSLAPVLAEPVPSTPMSEPPSLELPRPGPPQQQQQLHTPQPSSPMQPTVPPSADRFRPYLMAPPPLPAPQTPVEPAVQQQASSASSSTSTLPARLSTLSSFTRRVDPQQQVSPSAAVEPPSPAAVPGPGPSWSFGASLSPKMQMPPAASHPSAAYPSAPYAPAAHDHSPLFYPGSLPPSTRLASGGAPAGSTRTPSPPLPPPLLAARSFGIHPDRDHPPYPQQQQQQQPYRTQSDGERYSTPLDRREYGPGGSQGPSPTGYHAPPGSSPSVPPSFAPPPLPHAPASYTPLGSGPGAGDPLPTVASPFPPHRPSFGPPPPAFGHLGPSSAGRGGGGFSSPAMRGGAGGGVRSAFAPPSGPRSSMAPPTGPRGFGGGGSGGGGGGGFRGGRAGRGGGGGGGDFVPRAPRSMGVDDQQQQQQQPVVTPSSAGGPGRRIGSGGGPVMSDRPPPPSWMSDDRSGPASGVQEPLAGAGGGGAGPPSLPPPLVMPRLGGGGGTGYGRGRGGFGRGGGRGR